LWYLYSLHKLLVAYLHHVSVVVSLHIMMAGGSMHFILSLFQWQSVSLS